MINYLSRYKNETIVGAVALLLYFLSFKEYFVLNTSDFIGLLILFAVTKRGNGKPILYFILGIPLLSLAIYTHLTTFHFLSVCFILVGSYGYLKGSINHLPIFVLLITSPVYDYFEKVITIPIRLQLSEIAGTLLQSGNFPVQTEGNLVHFSNTGFLIDAGCAGLNLLKYGLLLTTLLLSILEINRNRRFSFIFISISLLGMFMLNIFSNILRIIILILFKIMPENIFHDVSGLITFILCCLIPYGLLHYLFIKKQENQPYKDAPTNKEYLIYFSLFILIPLGYFINNKPQNTYNYVYHTPDKCHVETLEFGVKKYLSDDYLIYEKPIENWFSADHNPLICWKGSGYKMGKIKTLKMNNIEIYTAELTKGTSTLYTAWWYQSKKSSTINHYQWRKDFLLNKNPFSLINVTVKSKHGLERFLLNQEHLLEKT